MKKLFILFAAIVAVSISLRAQDFYVKNDDGVRIYYNITTAGSKTVEVVKGSRGKYSGVVNIPASVSRRSNTYAVTEIGEGAFAECASLSSVTIPNSVTEIGEKAFKGCTSLDSIGNSNSVRRIGNYAFDSCVSLSSIVIPNSVIEIGNRAFLNCISLSYITFPNSVKEIEYWAFYGCSSLSSIVIPNSVTEIEEGTFYGCSSLSDITIQNSEIEIGNLAFHGTAWFEGQAYGEVYINKCLYVYKGEMPTNTSIIVRDGTTMICNGAFTNCSLSSITIPNSVTKIEHGALCSSEWFANQDDGMVYAGKCLYAYKGFTPAKSHIIVKDSTTMICTGVFFNCNTIDSISIP